MPVPPAGCHHGPPARRLRRPQAGHISWIGEVIKRDEQAIQPKLDLLAIAQYDSAQWLLYEALRANGERYADRAAELPLEGEHRFLCGYLSNSYWTTRQLLEATTSHMSDDHFASLEAAILAYAPSWESRDSAGWSSFMLLSAMDEARLSADGKRRLGELRRRFNMDRPPSLGRRCSAGSSSRPSLRRRPTDDR